MSWVRLVFVMCIFLTATIKESKHLPGEYQTRCHIKLSTFSFRVVHLKQKSSNQTEHHNRKEVHLSNLSCFVSSLNLLHMRWSRQNATRFDAYHFISYSIILINVNVGGRENEHLFVFLDTMTKAYIQCCYTTKQFSNVFYIFMDRHFQICWITFHWRS